MKTILKAMLVVFGLTNSMVSADILGKADDTYIGFQLTTPLDLRSWKLFSNTFQHHYILIRQKTGVKDGIAFKKDNNGSQVFSYLRPSTSFDISARNISAFAIPIMRLDAEASSKSKPVTQPSTNNAVGGLAVLAILSVVLINDLKKPWRPASPD